MAMTELVQTRDMSLLLRLQLHAVYHDWNLLHLTLQDEWAVAVLIWNGDRYPGWDHPSWRLPK